MKISIRRRKNAMKKEEYEIGKRILIRYKRMPIESKRIRIEYKRD